jgi:NAD(P)-dependent dehydrogenase (short-subunit alcohol dehydrogenase family)
VSITPVLITGGTSGIGLATARKFASLGHPIGVLTVAPEAERQAVEAELIGLGVAARIIEADVSDAAAVAAGVALLADALGPAGIVVNNAGIWVSNPVPESPLSLFDRHIDVNLKGPFYVLQAALPAMIAAGVGHVVNIASVSGTAGRAGDSAYSASKAGLAMLTRTLAAELGAKGIRINCLCPGAVATPLTAPLREAAGEAGVADLLAEHCSPNGRFFMDPADMAEIIAFLVSPAARAIHGAVIQADEGLTSTM